MGAGMMGEDRVGYGAQWEHLAGGAVWLIRLPSEHGYGKHGKHGKQYEVHMGSTRTRR